MSGPIGWFHLASDLAVFFAYTVLCGLLMVFLYRHRDLPHRKTIWLLWLFVFAAGFTRLMGGVMFYYPVFRLLLVVKVAAASIALIAVFAVARIFPNFIGFDRSSGSYRKSAEDAANHRRAEAHFVEQRDQLEQRATHLTVRDRRVRRALQSSAAAACSWDLENSDIFWEVGLKELLGVPEEAAESARSWTGLLDFTDCERLRAAARNSVNPGQEFSLEIPRACIRGREMTLVIRGRIESPSASPSGRSIVTGLVLLAPPVVPA